MRRRGVGGCWQCASDRYLFIGGSVRRQQGLGAGGAEAGAGGGGCGWWGRGGGGCGGAVQEVLESLWVSGCGLDVLITAAVDACAVAGDVAGVWAGEARGPVEIPPAVAAHNAL